MFFVTSKKKVAYSLLFFQISSRQSQRPWTPDRSHLITSVLLSGNYSVVAGPCERRYVVLVASS